MTSSSRRRDRRAPGSRSSPPKSPPQRWSSRSGWHAASSSPNAIAQKGGARHDPDHRARPCWRGIRQTRCRGGTPQTARTRQQISRDDRRLPGRLRRRAHSGTHRIAPPSVGHASHHHSRCRNSASDPPIWSSSPAGRWRCCAIANGGGWRGYARRRDRCGCCCGSAAARRSGDAGRRRLSAGPVRPVRGFRRGIRLVGFLAGIADTPMIRAVTRSAVLGDRVVAAVALVHADSFGDDQRLPPAWRRRSACWASPIATGSSTTSSRWPARCRWRCSPPGTCRCRRRR